MVNVPILIVLPPLVIYWFRASFFNGLLFPILVGLDPLTDNCFVRLPASTPPATSVLVIIFSIELGANSSLWTNSAMPLYLILIKSLSPHLRSLIAPLSTAGEEGASSGPTWIGLTFFLGASFASSTSFEFIWFISPCAEISCESSHDGESLLGDCLRDASS